MTAPDNHATGSVQNTLAIEEHDHAALAKRIIGAWLNDAGTNYVGATAYQFTANNALAVVLVDPTNGSGDPYKAGTGGGAGGVSAAISALYTAVPVNTTADQLLARRSGRTGFVIDYQRGESISVFVGYDSSVTGSNGGRELESGESWDMSGSGVYEGPLYAATTTGTITLMVHEFWS